jgi:GlpG protein
MRKIGVITSGAHAERFHRYLESRGIQNRIDEQSGNWEVWVYDEEKIPDAKQELADFQSSPDAKQYSVAPPPRPAATPVVKTAPRRPISRGSDRPAVTTIILMLMIVVTLGTDFGENQERTSALLFSPPAHNRDWTPILQGEYWRLITPIFLHMSIIHILFNGYMFWMLGGVIEQVKGSRTLLMLVLSIGVLSNIVQFLTAGGQFGGMSGVVYGLFGYIWMRARFLPEDGFYMPREIVIQLVVWAFICLMLDQIANGAHFGGLIVGMAIGAFPRLWRRSIS